MTSINKKKKRKKENVCTSFRKLRPDINLMAVEQDRYQGFMTIFNGLQDLFHATLEAVATSPLCILLSDFE